MVRSRARGATVLAVAAAVACALGVGALHVDVGAPLRGPTSHAEGALERPSDWVEAESPNYVRLVGPACIGEALAPGEVRYAPLDALGRAGRVEACVTAQMVEEGTARERTEGLPDPAGWGHNGRAEIELPDGSLYRGWFWNRSHLLAKSLGGADTLENLVCGTRMQNVGANDGQGGMAMVETVCRSWLRDYPDQTIAYVATPLYVGLELVPRSVVVDARSSDGSIDEEVEVYNCAKGYAIDYVTGTYERA